jgi:hypothetical protein
MKVTYRVADGDHPVGWGFAIITRGDGTVQEEPISLDLFVHLVAREVAMEEVRLGLVALRERMDGGFTTDCGGFNTSVYDFDGQKMVDDLIGKVE